MHMVMKSPFPNPGLATISLASQPLFFFFFFFLVKGEEKKKASGDFSQVSVGRWNAIT